MDWFVRAFLRASVVWLSLGVSLGVVMTMSPAALIYRTAHLHMLMLGFVAMMIFGVAYHVIPRFVGRPLRSPAIAGAHWWLANAGLALLVGGFLARPHAGGPGQMLIALGGLAAALGAYSFAVNIWLTLGPPAARAAARGVPLPMK